MGVGGGGSGVGFFGAQFTCFTGTKVQILTQKAAAGRCEAAAEQEDCRE